MKPSTYHGLVKRTDVYGTCSKCGGTKKGPYRWMEGRHWVYKIMPCHFCSMEILKKDPDYSSRIELAETWVDLPLEEQRARWARVDADELEAHRRVLERLTGTTLTNQRTEPPSEQVDDDLPNEP